MEPRLGHDFSRVRVHTDTKAAESARGVSAQAYTLGHNVVFASGRYAPSTAEGKKLLAHELTHVVQQQPEDSRSGSAIEVSEPSGPVEQQAEYNAERVLESHCTGATPDTSGRLARAPDEPLVAQKGVADAVYGQKFAKLGPMWMKMLLEELDRLTREELLALKQHSAAAEPYGRLRLELAMDAVWYRKFDRGSASEFRAMLPERMSRVIPFPDQRAEINEYLYRKAAKSETKPEAAAQKGTGQKEASHEGAGTAKAAISAEQVTAFGTEEQTAFKRQVYNAQMKNALRVKSFSPGLAAEDMEVVEKGQRMRKDAAASCRKLLQQSRGDLEKKQDENDELAQQVKSIGVGSAYRDPREDFRIWDGLFAKYYKETAEKRAELDGGEHGGKAVQYLASYISQYKAVAGFSNHSSGIAVDFVTAEGKEILGADKGQNPRWKKSWLHKWLVDNASTFGFQPLATEAWHWDYRRTEEAPGRPDTG